MDSDSFMRTLGAQRGLHESWGHHPAGKRARSSGDHPTKDSRRRAKYLRQGVSSGRENVFDKYEASVARVASRGGKVVGNRAVPDMHSWAAVLGVDIDSSKVTEREHRRLELEEVGHNWAPGAWNPAPSTKSREERHGTAQQRQASSPGRRESGPPFPGGKRRAVPEVVALNGFLSDLHDRLHSVETGAVRAGTTPAPSSFVRVGSGSVNMNIHTRRDSGKRSMGLVDEYGIPQSLLANAEEVRRTKSCDKLAQQARTHSSYQLTATFRLTVLVVLLAGLLFRIPRCQATYAAPIEPCPVCRCL